jgi:hypothetical protein
MNLLLAHWLEPVPVAALLVVAEVEVLGLRQLRQLAPILLLQRQIYGPVFLQLQLRPYSQASGSPCLNSSNF